MGRIMASMDPLDPGGTLGRKSHSLWGPGGSRERRRNSKPVAKQEPKKELTVCGKKDVFKGYDLAAALFQKVQLNRQLHAAQCHLLALPRGQRNGSAEMKLVRLLEQDLQDLAANDNKEVSQAPSVDKMGDVVAPADEEDTEECIVGCCTPKKSKGKKCKTEKTA